MPGHVRLSATNLLVHLCAGLTIQGGSATGGGAMLFSSSASPVISYVTFHNNTVRYSV